MIGRRPALGFAIALLTVVLVVLLIQTERAYGSSSYWYRLAMCETGGRWSQRGSTYVGGLGIWYGNWQRWSQAVGVNKPAYLATPAEQIRVAMYGRRVDGAWWGCFRIVGLPW